MARAKLDEDASGARETLSAAQDDLPRGLEGLRENSAWAAPGPADRARAGARPGRAALTHHGAGEIEELPSQRLASAVEAAAYYVVAEAITNVAKYAQASHAKVAVRRSNGTATVTVRDDGVGGADPARGSGLRGLAARVEALNGRLEIDSQPDGGTVVTAQIPS